MDEAVTATEAHRRFPSLLERVREGLTYVITWHGRPIARIVPANAEVNRRTRHAALLARLRRQEVAEAGAWVT